MSEFVALYVLVGIGVALPFVMSNFENKWSGPELFAAIAFWPVWLVFVGLHAIVMGVVRLAGRGIRSAFESKK